jgi:hypothetical protein
MLLLGSGLPVVSPAPLATAPVVAEAEAVTASAAPPANAAAATAPPMIMVLVLPGFFMAISPCEVVGACGEGSPSHLAGRCRGPVVTL